MTRRNVLSALLALSLLISVLATSGCNALSGKTSAEESAKMYKGAPKDPNE